MRFGVDPYVHVDARITQSPRKDTSHRAISLLGERYRSMWLTSGACRSLHALRSTCVLVRRRPDFSFFCIWDNAFCRYASREPGVACISDIIFKFKSLSRPRILRVLLCLARAKAKLQVIGTLVLSYSVILFFSLLFAS